MRNATLLFLVKKTNGEISDVCLAMKKRGFGAGRWNGAGGKVNEREGIEDATIRETQEEIGINPKNLSKVAELYFTFPHNETWNQIVHVYFSEKWEGELKESEEMSPRWFKVSEIPFSEMWPDDIFWLPKVLNKELVEGSFTFGEGDTILNQQIQTVDSFNKDRELKIKLS